MGYTTHHYSPRLTSLPTCTTPWVSAILVEATDLRGECVECRARRREQGHGHRGKHDERQDHEGGCDASCGTLG